MGFLDKLRGRRSTAPTAPLTVKCPLCGEENPVGPILCQICRGPLPPRADRPAASDK
jgi:hypothetical protein